MMKLTKIEFEQQFAVHNGLPVGFLHVWGLRAITCDCGAPDCPGWRMELVEKLEHGVTFATEDLVPYDQLHLN